MSKASKRIKRAEEIGRLEFIFACPICRSSMAVVESRSLICLKYNHTFDLSRHGSINFLPQPVKSSYGKELFVARRELIARSGFFAPLTQAIVEVIMNTIKDSCHETPTILDAGCGEGSHLSGVCERVSSNLGRRISGVGIDISKEGITEASKNFDDRIWLVADLAHTPFKDRQFDVLLNILSPSNYAEFNRLLKDNGLVIKVVPQRDYLKELRHFFFIKDQQFYSNSRVVERFRDHFPNFERLQLRYTRVLDRLALQQLVQMTPLTWAVSKARKEQFLEQGLTEITIDLDVLIGKKAF